MAEEKDKPEQNLLICLDAFGALCPSLTDNRDPLNCHSARVKLNFADELLKKLHESELKDSIKIDRLATYETIRQYINGVLRDCDGSHCGVCTANYRNILMDYVNPKRKELLK